MATETRRLPPFESIELSGSNDVEVQVGAEQSVVVHADEDLLDRVLTEVRGNTLVIDNEDNGYTTDARRSVEVTVPSLDAVTLSGSGRIDVADVDARDLTVSLSGSGAVNASGRTRRLEVSVSGSGDAQLAELAADDVLAEVSGAGRIVVHATASLEASVPGTGAIVYAGEPEHVTSSVTGVGVVTRG